MLKILHPRLQQYMNWELPDVQARFRKGRGTRDQIANIHWIIEKAREFQKNICFSDYRKAFDYVDHNKLWKILKEMEIPDYLTEKTVCRSTSNRTRHRTTDWWKMEKGLHLSCILSPCLFNFYAKYIKQNAGLGGSQTGIKIDRRNINNLRYADDTTLLAQSKE